MPLRFNGFVYISYCVIRFQFSHHVLPGSMSRTFNSTAVGFCDMQTNNGSIFAGWTLASYIRHLLYDELLNAWIAVAINWRPEWIEQ